MALQFGENQRLTIGFTKTTKTTYSKNLGGTRMKNIYLPTRLIRHHLVANIINKDKHFRGFIFYNIIFLLGDSFHFGDWWANGKRDMPFTWYPDKEELFYLCGIKTTEQEKKFYQLMSELNNAGIFFMEDSEHYMKLEFPTLMKYVDKTNEDDLRKKIGKKEEWSEGLIKHSQNGDNYLEVSSNQKRENNTIINKTKTNTSNYKDNIRDINSSSSQALSDKGSDDDITFDTMAYAQQVSDECERNEREYQEIMKDIEKNKEKE